MNSSILFIIFVTFSGAPNETMFVTIAAWNIRNMPIAKNNCLGFINPMVSIINPVKAINE